MRLNRALIFLPAISLLLLPLCASAADFSDVSQTHKNVFAIKTLKDAGLVSGYPDGTFKPDKSVSRAEAAAMILKAAGITTAKTAQKIPFTDVPEDAWFFAIIQKGVEMKILKGYEDKTFRPANPVTLPEAIALTLSFFKINTRKLPVDALIYGGLQSDEWYSKPLQYAKNQNLAEPDENGSLNPAASLTRGQLAEIIYRMRTAQQTKKPFDITSGWVTTEYKENFWKLRHPSDWEIFKGQKNSVIWKRDPVAGTSTHIFFTRVWPASARISISAADNPENLTAAQYFAKLKTAYSKSYKPPRKPIYTETALSGKPTLKIQIPQRRIADAAIALPNNNFLMIYGEAGEADIGEFLKKQIELAIDSYEYVEKPPEPPKPVIPLAERLSTLRENILIKEKWNELKDLFPDKKLINTDAIGIGTGPVDYYFSAEANQTIKLERESGTVLNVKEGKTETF